ncbi:MAG: hypothetical protein KAR32_04555, partial [Candidatus Omnitrophica bacterium]|nr:hypothetical protein [Candidatus Omnitrophota bacterium]
TFKQKHYRTKTPNPQQSKIKTCLKKLKLNFENKPLLFPYFFYFFLPLLETALSFSSFGTSLHSFISSLFSNAAL